MADDAEGRRLNAEAPPRTPILEIRGVSKRFGSTQALDDVSLALHAGEIHALLGENGAGKSTLIKIMTGVVQPDGGELIVDGRTVRMGSALEAQALGIAAVYQEPMIFPDLSSANLTVKAIMYTANCRFGGVLRGTTHPVAFMSRADDVPTRLNSLALAERLLGLE